MAFVFTTTCRHYSLYQIQNDLETQNYLQGTHQDTRILHVFFGLRSASPALCRSFATAVRCFKVVGPCVVGSPDARGISFYREVRVYTFTP